jgi:hypothetical protein
MADIVKIMDWVWSKNQIQVIVRKTRSKEEAEYNHKIL